MKFLNSSLSSSSSFLLSMILSSHSGHIGFHVEYRESTGHATSALVTSPSVICKPADCSTTTSMFCFQDVARYSEYFLSSPATASSADFEILSEACFAVLVIDTSSPSTVLPKTLSLTASVTSTW